MYIIKDLITSKITLSEDKKKVFLDQTIFYNREGETKLQDNSAGCTIELSLEAGDRNTLYSELQQKTLEWFNLNFNS